MSSPSSVLYLRLPSALHRQLAKLAAQNRRTLTLEAQVAIEAHMAAEKEKTT
jgi:predicted transcriptional regulator